MADIVTRTKKITRDKLSKFLPNHEAIKAFEDLTHDVVTTIPDAISSIGEDTDPVLASNLFGKRPIVAPVIGGAADAGQLLAGEAFRRKTDIPVIGMESGANQILANQIFGA